MIMMEKRRKSFPERLALVYDLTEPARAYEMRYANELRVAGGECDVKDGPLLRYTLKCEVVEAVLLVTPYVRLVQGEQLRGRLVFRIDGHIVTDARVERYLVPNMESPILDIPMVRPPGKPLYYASYVNEEGRVPTQSVHGIMEPNGSLLELEIKEPVFSPGVKVEAGCIAALYTTKK